MKVAMTVISCFSFFMGAVTFLSGVHGELLIPQVFYILGGLALAVINFVYIVILVDKEINRV